MAITGRQLTIAGIIFAALILALSLHWLIITDKDRIHAAVSDMVKAVEKGDAGRLFKHVSPAYRDEVHSYIGLRIAAEAFLGRHEDVWISVRDEQINITGPVAVDRVRVLASSSNEGSSVSVWDVRFERQPDKRWLVTRITPVRINNQEVSGWGGVYKGW